MLCQFVESLYTQLMNGDYSGQFTAYKITYLSKSSCRIFRSHQL